MYQSTLLQNGKFPDVIALGKAIAKASNANSDFRDSRDLFYILERLKQFPRLNGLINTRLTALTSYDWNLKANDDTYKNRLDEVTARLKRNIDLLLSWHTDIPYFGSLLVEIKSNLIENENILNLTHFEPIDYEKLDENGFYIYDNMNSKKTKYSYSDNINNYIYITDGNKDLGGIGKGIAAHVIGLFELLPEWNIIIRRQKGVITATADADALQHAKSVLNLTDSDIQKTLDDAKTTAENIGVTESVLQTLNGIEFKLNSIADSNASNSISIYKSALESDLSIAILGQANTSELPSSGGSRAALQILNLIRTDLLYADMINIKKAINELIRIDNYLNYNIPTPAFSFDFVYDTENDTESEARKLTYIIQSGINLQVSKQEVYDKLGYSIPTEGDELITLGTANNQTTMRTI